MSWWLIFSILAVIIAGILAGMIISSLFLKKPKRLFPFITHRDVRAVNGDYYRSDNGTTNLKEFTVEKIISGSVRSKNSPPIPEKLSHEPDSSEKNLPTTVKKSLQKCAALIELEENLSVALRPETDKLANFQTDIWNSRRGDFEVLNSELLGELTEAYVDMLLANNIVWLVTELGRNSQDLKNSYNKLSSKIAERLQKVLPDARNVLNHQ